MVPTFYARTPLFEGLLAQLDKQIRPGVKVIAARGERDPARIGEKWQRLNEASRADYICWCADDALLHPEYVSKIHDAMQYGPDCIGFILQLVGPSGDGAKQAHSIAFGRVPDLHWPGRPDLHWGTYFCDFGGWMPVKRSIGILARCDGDDDRGEDDRWTRGVVATGLLKTEVYFDEVLVQPQLLDQGFHGSWQSVEPTPNPERPYLSYV